MGGCWCSREASLQLVAAQVRGPASASSMISSFWSSSCVRRSLHCLTARVTSWSATQRRQPDTSSMWRWVACREPTARRSWQYCPSSARLTSGALKRVSRNPWWAVAGLHVHSSPRGTPAARSLRQARLDQVLHFAARGLGLGAGGAHFALLVRPLHLLGQLPDPSQQRLRRRGQSALRGQPAGLEHGSSGHRRAASAQLGPDVAWAGRLPG